jgi:FixJ family two-component response regulator
MLYEPAKNVHRAMAQMTSPAENEEPARPAMARWHPGAANRFSNPVVAPATVFVVERDFAQQEAIEQLVVRAGFLLAVAKSAEDFLSKPTPRSPNCVVIGASLRGQEALDLQARLSALRPETTVIFVSACDQIDVAVKAMKAGATEYLMQPLDAGALIAAIQDAVEISRGRCIRASRLSVMQDRYARLSQREQQVMKLVTAGQLNKQIGGTLGICEMTVKAHRGKVMSKMKASSLADLVNMAAVLGFQRPK